jgi:hypothetical protein
MGQSHFGTWRCGVDETARSRTHSLECLRLETDCRELAFAIDRPDLALHFVRMARAWAARAESERPAPVVSKPTS